MTDVTKHFDNTDDKRVENNSQGDISGVTENGLKAMRMTYRELSDNEKKLMGDTKIAFAELWNKVATIGESRELSLAKRHLEDACMRVVRHITG